MKPTLYSKISKLIAEHQLKSITVDIFDTIILNDYWPSDLRCCDLSAKQLPVIHQFISKQITSYELYDTRRCATRLLKSSNLPYRLDVWLTETVELLCIKYHIILNDEQKLSLLADLIKIELEFTIENCHPNHALISQLQRLKQQNPDLNIYFLDHGYLASEQVKLLLEIYQINLFNGGVTAADLNQPTDEELFNRLPQTFHLHTNLHIDDHHQNILSLKVLDAHAIHYRPIRMRGLRTLIGQTWLQLLRYFTLRRARQLAPLDTWTAIGEIIALRGQIATQKLIAFANLHLGNYLLAVKLPDSELLDQIGFRHAEVLDQKTLLHAFIWLLANYSSPRWNAPELLKLLLRETSISSRTELYQTCFTNDYTYSELAITSFTEDEFHQNFLNEIKTAAPIYTQKLRHAYELTLTYLPSDTRTTFFVTMHDDGSTKLFREFARLHNISSPIESLVLNPNLTFESTEKYIAKHIGDYQNSQLQLGQRLAGTINYELAPETYLEKVLQPQLRHLAKTFLPQPKHKTKLLNCLSKN